MKLKEQVKMFRKSMEVKHFCYGILGDHDEDICLEINPPQVNYTEGFREWNAESQTRAQGIKGNSIGKQSIGWR